MGATTSFAPIIMASTSFVPIITAIISFVLTTIIITSFVPIMMRTRPRERRDVILG